MGRLTDEQAQERYLADVRFAIHLTKQGRFRLFERMTGDDVGNYASEPEARTVALSVDPRAMVRINQEKIVGGPTVAELEQMGLEACRKFLKLHPGHVGAGNVLAELERELEAHRKLARSTKRTAVQNGMSKSRWSASGPRCPTKRELR